jgi:hypothetical protein
MYISMSIDIDRRKETSPKGEGDKERKGPRA